MWTSVGIRRQHVFLYWGSRATVHALSMKQLCKTLYTVAHPASSRDRISCELHLTVEETWRRGWVLLKVLLGINDSTFSFLTLFLEPLLELYGPVPA